MYLDLANTKYIGAEIGRAMLKLMNDFNGGPIIAESDGGARQEDASH